MSVTFHADDYGITEQQAADILKLSQVCGGQGALSSVSIFANSPAFEAAAEMARPYVESGKLAMALHLNLVEGRPCAPVAEVPLLVNQRGTFANDFVGLLKLSMGAQRWAFRQQLQRECVAQIQRYLAAFPQMKRTMRVDSHQHTHAGPAVFDALSQAMAELGVTVTHLRCPIEPLAPHRAAGSNMPPVNLAKDALITWLWRKNRSKMPAACEVPLFCGVVLSGAMDTVDWPLLDAFESLAADRGKNVQVLFHPV
ncbi:MAG: ChbG/HpnK family deacetylase, partial [Senegalimassilia anaerobia]|nr:ChbG/HpnK family deacetylase [Senegalimassilia anaerobia]